VNGSQFSVADGDGSGALVTAAGELDLAVKDDLRDVLTPLRGRVTIDLAAVTFIDSSAIGVLVGAHKRLSTDGGTLLLRNPQDMPRRALEIVGLGEWIED
jgi:anti-sigma B factor antagonist